MGWNDVSWLDGDWDLPDWIDLPEVAAGEVFHPIGTIIGKPEPKKIEPLELEPGGLELFKFPKVEEPKPQVDLPVPLEPAAKERKVTPSQELRRTHRIRKIRLLLDRIRELRFQLGLPPYRAVPIVFPGDLQYYYMSEAQLKARIRMDRLRGELRGLLAMRRAA